MEGPTPVSAMIHAATMVSAGVYAVVRMFPLLHAGLGHGGSFTAPMLAMGLIGAFTALFASIIAIAQNDIKRVLAYSTIAQLGYMIAALGVGAWVAAAFHLVTHAFFKALLVPRLRLGDSRRRARASSRGGAWSRRTQVTGTANTLTPTT